MLSHLSFECLGEDVVIETHEKLYSSKFFFSFPSAGRFEVVVISLGGGPGPGVDTRGV